MKVNSFSDLILAILTMICIVLFFGLLVSLPVMLLWNYCLVPAIAGVAKISWLQAWGLLIILS